MDSLRVETDTNHFAIKGDPSLEVLLCDGAEVHHLSPARARELAAQLNAAADEAEAGLGQLGRPAMSWLHEDYVQCPVCGCMTDVRTNHFCPGPDEDEDEDR